MVVKICGLSVPEHALAAAEAGADMVGVIFAPSRRQVTREQAAAIRDALAGLPRRPDLVGVFVNARVSEMLDAVERCGLDLIQLSGDEPPSILAAMPGRRAIKTLRLSGSADEEAWLRPGPHHDRVRLHVDAHVAGSYGGAGVVGDWGRAAEQARRTPILLAGGLTPENVAAAIAQVAPWGVDVSSGVEIDGRKDPQRIRAFVAAARGASPAPGISEGGVS